MKTYSLLFLVAAVWFLAACGSLTNAPSNGAQTNNASLTGVATARPSTSSRRTASPVATSAASPTARPTTAATAQPTRQRAQSTATREAQASATPQAQVTPTSQQPQPTTAQTSSTVGSEVLFLRAGNLMAYSVDSGSERQIAEDVHAFAATSDGRLLALVRGSGSTSELWLVNRDGSGLRQLTTNQRAEDTPVFAPDGLTIAFAAAPDGTAGRTWGDWSRWCRQSRVLLLDIAAGQERPLGAGCDPAFSPDGKRIAFATAPTSVEEASAPDLPLAYGNAIRLVNRQGQNGWNFATAGNPAKPESGKLVFAPSWSPDGRQIVYHRFVGYQSLTDMVYTEVGNSFEGKGKRVDFGAGWLLPARFAPTGGMVAISDNNDSDARGWGGYEQWSVGVIRLTGQRQVALPEGPTDLASTTIDSLARAQDAAWSPDGTALVVELPPGWKANLETNQPLFTDEKPGELWRWQPGQAPAQKLVSNADFASPLLWLPAVK